MNCKLSEDNHNREDLSKYSYYKGLIESKLKKFFDSIELEEPLKGGVKHFIFPGGKFLRPLMSLLFAEDLKISENTIKEEVLPFSVAIELIHTSTLIHDDLPCIDDDDERRGIQSCHKKFDEATALLSGDILISLALELAFESSAGGVVKDTCLKQLVKAYTQVCRGQNLDIINYSDKTKLNNLKTGELFKASLLIPAHFKIDSSSILNSISKFSLDFGNYYQLIDDYIDVFGSSEKRGRSKSSDLKNNKETKSATLKKKEAFKNLENVFSLLLNNLSKLEKELSLYLKEEIEIKLVRELLLEISKRA